MTRLRGTLLLDLRYDLEDLWLGIRKRRREEINQAEHQGIKVTSIPDEQQQEEWLRIYDEMCKQKRLKNTIDPDFLKSEPKRFVFFIASIKDKVLSGELYRIRAAAFPPPYEGNGLSLEMNHSATLRQIPLADLGHARLIWESIKWAKTNNFSEYDFGGWTCYRPGNEGIRQWKESFGGNVIWYWTEEQPRKDELAEMRKATIDPSKAIVWVDDGHLSAYDKGRDFFKKLQVKPILAIITGYVGQIYPSPKYGPSPIMKMDQILDLINDGWEIASHSITHRDFLTFGIEETEKELSESKEWIRDHLGVIPTKFAFPYNRYTIPQFKLAQKYYDYVRPLIPPRPPQPNGIHAIFHRFGQEQSFRKIEVDSAMLVDYGFVNYASTKYIADPVSLNLDTYSSKKAVDFYTQTELQDAEKLAFRFLKSPGSILDVGCGTGRTSIWLHNRGFSVTGIDISEPMISRARELRPDIRFEVGDVLHLQFADSTFDYVLFSFNGLDLLYPEEQRLKALKEINRVLKPAGIFIFSSHNMERIVRNEARVETFEPPYYTHQSPYGSVINYFISWQDQERQLRKEEFEPLAKYNGPEDAWIYYIAKTVKDPSRIFTLKTTINYLNTNKTNT